MVQGEGAYLHDTGKTASDGKISWRRTAELIAAGTYSTMFNGHATQYKAKPLQVI